MTFQQLVHEVQAILHDDSPPSIPEPCDDRMAIPLEFYDLLVATTVAKFMEVRLWLTPKY